MDPNARIGVIALGILCGGAAAAVAQTSPIAAENARPGTTDWLLTKVEAIAVNVRDDRYRRQRSIEGYVSHSSIRAGETLTGFVSTQPASRCRVEIYRMGWYGGKGGRLMTTLGPLNGVAQPEPVEGEKQLVEARWTRSFELRIPPDWLSGVYLGKLTSEATGDQSYLIWVVRDDRKADLMFQVSDLTWQAYNRWPAWRSLYDWRHEKWRTTPGAKVSFEGRTPSTTTCCRRPSRRSATAPASSSSGSSRWPSGWNSTATTSRTRPTSTRTRILKACCA